MINSDKAPLGFFGRLKKRKQWKVFKKETLAYIDKDMNEQHVVVIKSIIDEILAETKPPITDDSLIMNFITLLKENSNNMNELRAYYVNLKHNLIRFFAKVDTILKGEQ